IASLGNMMRHIHHHNAREASHRKKVSETFGATRARRCIFLSDLPGVGQTIGVSSVCPRFSSTAGVWSIANGKLINGSFWDGVGLYPIGWNNFGGYEADQSFTAMFGGVQFLLSTRAVLFAVPGGGNVVSTSTVYVP